jgi:hypothetical protein
MFRPQREISRYGTLATWAEELGLEGPFGSSRLHGPSFVRARRDLRQPGG